MTEFSADDVVSEAQKIVTRATRGWDSQDREDLLGIVLERYVKQFGDDDAPDDVARWLQRVTTNAKTDFYRKRGREQDHAARVLPDAKDEGDASEQLLENLRAGMSTSLLPVWEDVKRRVLALIPTEQRDVFEARYLDNRSAKDVADDLGIKPAAVDQRAKRARDHLKAALDGQPELLQELTKPHPKIY